MKKSFLLTGALCLCGLLSGCSAGANGTFAVIAVIAGVLLLLFAAMRTVSYVQYEKRRKRNPRRKAKSKLDAMTVICYGIGAALLFIGLLLFSAGGEQTPSSQGGSTTGSSLSTSETTEPTEPPVLFAPNKTSVSDPANWGITWEIFENYQKIDSFTRQEPISFGDPEDYFPLPGIGAFRGNNYRNTTSYGTAEVNDQTLSIDWSVKTSTLPGSNWSGSGWTGQPLIVQWDGATREHMNLYADKKAKTDLVEVIYATLDGHIYFLDLDDGSYTRDPINVAMCFKGAGSLDPRGYPLMYVGSGDVNSSGLRPAMFIISLIDGSILYEYGRNETMALRQDNDNWCAFDSSPLVDAETDTLIWPGENGLLYTIKLNSSYDAVAGTVSIDPEPPIFTRYNTSRSNASNYWYGYEASVNIVGSYLYVSENGGMFYCVDLNTMELVWAQDTKDDSNCSPVFEKISDEEAYVYTAPSLHWTKDANSQGTISLYKLNALTGEIVWEVPYHVHTVSGVSGGVQSTPLLGKPGTSLEGLILFTISRTPDVGTGYLVALDTDTGKEVWRMTMDYYAWSSPVAVYDENGTGYVVVCDSGGYAHLLNGSTGTVLNKIGLGGLVEATPAIFNDMLIVGTKAEKILGIKIK